MQQQKLVKAGFGIAQGSHSRPGPSVDGHQADASDLAYRLHLGIDSLHIGSTQQLAHTDLDPTNPQNELVLHRNVHDIPAEILLKIFSVFIYDPDPESQRVLAIDRVIQSIYQRLFTLIRVCSDWRGICLSKSAFWSLIPLLIRWQGAEKLCLERAGSSKLHLIGEFKYADPRLLEVITQYGPRIQTLDISGVNPTVVRETVASLLKHGASGCIANLSVRNYQASFRRDRFSESRTLFHPTSSQYASFNKFPDSLRQLRLCGFNLDWGRVHFSGLVELRLQELALEDNLMVTNLLLAVASASNLRSLKLIRMEVRRSIIIPDEELDQVASRLPVSLPSLQSLFLQDIHRDLLLFILQSITPGPYRIIICFTESSSFISQVLNGDPDQEDTLHIKTLELQDFNIDTLMISGNWLQGFKLHHMLKAMPSIKSLCVRGHTFTKVVLQALVRPPGSTTNGSDTDFPVIRRLHVVNTDFHYLALDKLKEVVNSHSIRELRLGRVLALEPWNLEEEKMIRFEDPRDSRFTGPIKDWLQANVPNFAVVRRMRDIPDSEFQMHVW
ncbi:unnamed protein product [Rhizoctonia solani]|uniref:F-box domain-containing protein n=1 Tax=Rhizoctonia solani TaxID=456999 RepID=A0A8H3B5J9_9AGAM|nr:unnamed protein product [Rhizoctonia solani]